jgi:hypothetical protein
VGSCNLFAVISNHFGERVEAELILRNHFWTKNWFVSKGRGKKRDGAGACCYAGWWVPVTFSWSISNHFCERVEAELIIRNLFWTQNWFVSKGRKKKDGACCYAGCSHRMLQYQLVIKKKYLDTYRYYSFRTVICTPNFRYKFVQK